MNRDRTEERKFEMVDSRFAKLEYITPQIIIFVSRFATPSWEIEEDTIGFIDLTYVYYGEATYTVNGTDYHATAGSLLCIPKGSVRRASSPSDNPLKSYALNFLLYNISGEEVELPFPTLSQIGIQPQLLDLYKRMNTEWIHKRPGHVLKCRAMIMTLLAELLGELYYKDDAQYLGPHVAAAVDYINEHYNEKLTVDFLAEMLGLSSVYFGVLFKNSMNQSVKRYINTVRMDVAESLLREGHHTIVEVAAQCGFEDAFYFSKVYKDIKKESPSDTMSHSASIKRMV